uniref:Uncharacterized protein n=1 Tax=Lepeophtheirus salmonis TaxID=72036 RepID=A0A0K2SXC2_LEPSM
MLHRDLVRLSTELFALKYCKMPSKSLKRVHLEGW